MQGERAIRGRQRAVRASVVNSVYCCCCALAMIMLLSLENMREVRCVVVGVWVQRKEG